MTGRTLIWIVVLGAFAANPAMRARVAPHVEPRVAPLLARAIDPVFEWSTRSRVAEVARRLGADLVDRRPLPSAAEFPAYLEAIYRNASGSRDSWGTVLYLRRSADGSRVASAGRDRVPYTGDDILSPLIVAER